MYSHVEVFLPDNPITPNNIGEALKGPQRQLLKEVLFVQYEMNKNVSLISDTIPIKSLHEVIKVLHLIITPRTKECGCYDAWKFFARHCANGRSQNQFINVDRSYTPVEHYD